MTRQFFRIWERYRANIGIAVQSLMTNKLRSGLTALGVIFGVGAVIAMLAIGSGARQEVLEQMALVGVNNIIIEAKWQEEDLHSESEQAGERRPYSPGLRLDDVQAVRSVISNVKNISPEVHFELPVIYEGRRQEGRLIGVERDFFELHNLKLQRGSVFNDHQTFAARPVCVIGHQLHARLFGGKDPIGEFIKAGDIWYRVVGVLQPRFITESAQQDLGVMDHGMDIFVPISTVLLRYRDRGNIMQAAFGRGGSDESRRNYHQIDRMVIQVDDTDRLEASASVIQRMLKRRHNNVEDFNISIPELLLRQERRTRDIFNMVLGAIAGISLLVGGIGIMNIMLASVWERIREIGLRKAVGATKNDIIAQFVAESVLLSLGGGIAGIILGVSLAYMISYFADIMTLVTMYSIVIAFVVSALVGLVFGIMPARKAAMQDPITSLRNE